MNIFVWIFFGILLGALANLLNPQPNRGGIIAAVILGVFGSVFGGVVANILFSSSLSDISMPTFLIATAGALFVLFFGRGIQKV